MSGTGKDAIGFELLKRGGEGGQGGAGIRTALTLDLEPRLFWVEGLP